MSGGVASEPTWQRVALPHVMVDEQAIVFDARRAQAHLLNPSATAVWETFTEPHTTGAVVAELEPRFEVDTATLAADIDLAVTDLHRAGLLDRDGPDPDHQWRDDPEAAGSPPRPPAPDDYHVERAWALTSPWFQALGCSFRFECTDPMVAAYLQRVLDPLVVASAATEPETGPSWTYRLWPATEPDRLVVATEHETITAGTTRSDAIARVLWHYNHEVIDRAPDLLLFHSSAVGTDSGTLALPAEANSGKSTLATALVRAGYHYLTDEALAVDPDTRKVRPYPKPIGLDPGSFPLFGDLEPAEADQPAELFHHKWWLDPRRLSALGDRVVPRESPALRAIVFPTFAADAEPAIHRLDPAPGVVRLARNTFNLARWGQRGLDVLAAVASSVPMYTMVHNDLSASTALLRHVIGPPPVPSASN